MRSSCITVALLAVGSLGLCIRAAAQQGPVEVLNEARAKMVQAEKEHGPQSKELADALRAFVIAAIDSDIRPLTSEFTQAAQRDIDVNAAAYGEGSGQHVDAIELASSMYAGSPRSFDLARQAAELARRLNPPEPHVLSRAVVWLGTLCGRLGDYSCALKAYDEGEAAELSSDKPEFEQVGKVLNNRAKLYAKLGRNEQALADFKRAYALWEKESGEARWNNLAFGQVSKNLGNTLLALGKPEEALPYLEQALRIFSQKLGPTKMHAAQARASIGRAYAVMGRFDQALPLLQEAVDEYRAAYSPIHYEVAAVLGMQAQALAGAGKLDEALKIALESERVSREYFLLIAASLPERQALDYAKSREHGLDLALSILAAKPELASASTYEEVVDSRSLVADGMAWRNQEAAQSNDPEVQALAQELKVRRARLAELAAASSPSGASFAATVSTAKAEFEQAEEKLAQHNGPFQREWQERQVSLQQINDGLPPESVLISYVRYRRYAVGRVDPTEESTESYAAFVTRRGEVPRFISLGAAKPIDDLVASLRDLIEHESEAPGISPATSLQKYQSTGSRLRRAVWDPVADSLGKNTKMYLVVPDGMLHFVNVAALPAQSGGYLIEKLAPIHRLTAERDLLSVTPPASSGLLAVGGADFGSASSTKPARRGLRLSCSDVTKVEFPALPGTEAEIHEIADLYRKSNVDASVVELTGNKATKQEFLSKAQSQSILHLATHAYFVPASCSVKDAAAGEKAEVVGLSSDNPLLRTGLVFSGRTTERLLTAQEISGLSLSGSRWAVLSACDSGIGEVQDGEGVLGLERAFRVAGVRTVLMSLWPVDDQSTRRFMDNLYRERFRSSDSTADAVQKATLQSLRQLRAKKQSTHPFYWAGFVASGDWR